VAHCDVFIENFKVGDMARYGWTTPAWRPSTRAWCTAASPALARPAPTPRAGYDYAVQGMGGLMSVTGERDDRGGGPQKVGVAVADLFTGMYARSGILAALRHAERTGRGQHMDMALLDTQVAMLANLGANYLVSGKVPGRAGNAHQNIVPYQVFEVAPSPTAAPTTSSWRWATTASTPSSARWPGGRAGAGRALRQEPRPRAHRAILVPLLEAVMKTRAKADWLAALEAAQVPCGAINNLAEVFSDPQVQERAMVDTWQHPPGAICAWWPARSS
jgi:crotonobetainyl-CoA:carnitine CoA-transferase CaiB-like acyl-CoA transferase